MYNLMKPKRVDTIPENNGSLRYIYEEKYDGGSAVIEKYGSNVKIYHGENPNPVTYRYPEIVEGALSLKDGIYVCEIVVFGKDGVNSFDLFQKRQLENKRKIELRSKFFPAVAIIHDILKNFNEDTVDLALNERKKILRDNVFDSNHIRLIEFYDKPDKILEKKDKIEGIVIKEINSTYKFGKRDGWYKYRFNKEEVVKCVDYEDTKVGIVLITEDGRRINLAGHRSEIAKKRLKEDGEVMVEVSYHRRTEKGFRFAVVKRILEG